MRKHKMTRRSFCAAIAGAGMAVATPARAAGPEVLSTEVTELQLAPEGYGPTQAWTYDGQLPGPVLRQPQGSRLVRRLENRLPVPTSIHWHGIRIDNTMDGVAGLTQEAVPPGGQFDYAFDLPDAGTYWYHAHTNSSEQVTRGLAGALIVDEATPPDIDRDEVLLLADWLLNPETGAFQEPFDHPMLRSHGGRFGNLIGTNGRFDFSAEVRQNERIRLRLINGATARIFGLRLEGLTGWTVALDGMPLTEPEPVTGELVLAPAQRIDLIVDVTAGVGETAILLRIDDDESWRAQAFFPVVGASATTRRPAPSALPPNPGMELPNLAEAQVLDMPMAGGAMGGLRSARFEGADLGFRDLVRRGQFWSLAGQVGMAERPFASLSRGATVRMKITNDTAFPHAMHLHGMHFREVRQGGGFGPMRDTVLSLPDQPLDIAFTADNPGKWLFHCHMLDHAASGMTTWIEVV
ncbi:multicopper oxidase family protein [Vannielia litorea]|uniref:Multicopper oxidase with three cupredoxin domains (Includes cell division protein FtsP and spore coat protein CotA) n=1 Tax=Vannielia litorea TaxID=1217970 RepID=A0A1N6IFK1_9RHOB|nr:multicopper oxidase family protein [Vannielia litorea]SIO30807.1 Multicopper oxidase with three cupredoxin domains (includes cell division protein FtsP and spore coat protein CotA) [Vannielia litorea]